MTITNYYVASDAMGSTTAILDEEGNVLERRSYEAFGEMNCMTPDGLAVATSPTEVDVGFQGQIRDETNDLYQMGYRYYSPALGRWLSRDPIGIKGGGNLYEMTKNNPADISDNLGLEPNTYKNQTAAARAALKAVNPLSIKENIEKCGMVCKDRKTGKYFTTGPVDGTIASCTPGTAPCPCTSTTVGYWHTHGGFVDKNKDRIDDYLSEEFSEADKKLADSIKGDAYVGTPGGKFKQYNYDPNNKMSGTTINRGNL